MERNDGVPFRGKADIIKDKMIIDLKTTSKIKDFEYSALNFGYDLQAYLYLQLFPEMEMKRNNGLKPKH